MIGYEVDVARQVVFIRQWGILTERDLVVFASAVRADPAVSPDWSTLTDARDVEEMRVSGAFLRGYRSAFAPTARRAVVVSSPLAMGMARMYELSRNLDEVLVVSYDTATALEWLGLPPDTVIPDTVRDVALRGKAVGEG